jgi:hypothetical protein
MRASGSVVLRRLYTPFSQLSAFCHVGAFSSSRTLLHLKETLSESEVNYPLQEP